MLQMISTTLTSDTHREDNNCEYTMQLVPQDIHSAVKHTGGAAVIKNQNKAK
jgi:A nuclease of the HNH/ENDO VII superfamily with conserved WHH